MSRLLETRGLEAFYGDFQALFGIDLAIDGGETVAIIGANGAGKSTFLRAITGLLPWAGRDIVFDGRQIGGLAPDRIHKHGLAMVPEGRRLFPSLSVEENLLIGASGGRQGTWTLEAIYDLFPDLVSKRRNPGTALSGGQQQMVAIGRALMANPRLLLCDEISLGSRSQDHPGHLPRGAADPGRRHRNHRRRAGCRPGACSRRPDLLLHGRARFADRHAR